MTTKIEQLNLKMLRYQSHSWISREKKNENEKSLVPEYRTPQTKEKIMLKVD